MSIPPIYDELAEHWPLVLPRDDYAAEATHWRETLREALGPGRHHVLDLGTGGGHSLSHLTEEFDATAVDLSPAMLANSERLNPGVEHLVGDMRSIRLGRMFDAVLIHDSVSYLLSEDDLAATFTTARIHLRPGGVLICAPDWTRETFDGPQAHVHGPHGDEREITTLVYDHDPDPTDTTIEAIFVFLIRKDGQVRVVEDRHLLGLFPRATWERQMTAAGLDVSLRSFPAEKDGHEAWLFIGRVPDRADDGRVAVSR